MRHRWGDPDREDPRLTVRICQHCGLRKLTHHGNLRSWQTYCTAGGIAYHGNGTPICFGDKHEIARLQGNLSAMPALADDDG